MAQSASESREKKGDSLLTSEGGEKEIQRGHRHGGSEKRGGGALQSTGGEGGGAKKESGSCPTLSLTIKSNSDFCCKEISEGERKIGKSIHGKNQEEGKVGYSPSPT